jgi:2'-5' RNA ligase
MRLFIAINLPAEERRAIRDAIAPLRAMDDAREVSWTKEDALHLTLKFLGEQTEAMSQSLADALRSVAARHRTVEMELDGVGAFPSWRAPTVLWVGVVESPKLELLHHDIEKACADLGHEIEGRPFRPHVTVGRVRRPLVGAKARTLADAARGVPFQRSVLATSVDLMSSTLAPGGSRYAVVLAAPFRED